jgi:hypothetical protein
MASTSVVRMNGVEDMEGWIERRDSKRPQEGSDGLKMQAEWFAGGGIQSGWNSKMHEDGAEDVGGFEAVGNGFEDAGRWDWRFEVARRTKDVGGFEAAGGWIQRDRTRGSKMSRDGAEDIRDLKWWEVDSRMLEDGLNIWSGGTDWRLKRWEDGFAETGWWIRRCGGMGLKMLEGFEGFEDAGG